MTLPYDFGDGTRPDSNFFNQLKADFVSLDGRATSLETRVTSLETRTTSLETRTTSLETRATALEARGEHWFTTGGGSFGVTNLRNVTNHVASSGTIDIDALAPGKVPSNATSVILTIEVGYDTAPAGTQIVSLRVMPDTYDLGNVLDRAKCQQVYAGGTIDRVAIDVRMPVQAGAHQFFYAVQSTDPLVANKGSIIDLWGYTT